MKKIAILLAFVICFACALVACNDAADESSAGESVAESVAESNVESDTGSEAESDAESEVESEVESDTEDTSSEAEDVSEEDVVISGSNVAEGKEYTVTGCGTGYINESGQWPSVYNASLTDGLASEELNFGTTSTWFAFYNNSSNPELINAPDGLGAIVIDLGEAYDLSAIRVHLGNHYANGVNSPNYVNVYTSADGNEFTMVGELEIKDAEETDNAVLAYWSEINAGTNARYVKVEFSLRGVFAFLDEIEIYGE